MTRRPRLNDRVVELSGRGWRSPPVVLAASFRWRWRGVRRQPGMGLLLWSRSVHGIGMRDPLALVRIDAGGTVRETGRLRPGRVDAARRPAWLLELPIGHPLPRRGERLQVRPYPLASRASPMLAR